MELDWLKLSLVSGEQVIRPGLSVNEISASDLPDICLRMHMILEEIEFSRCEGRMINLDIFDPIDTMESDLRHGKNHRLSDWLETIEKFGDYYNLDRYTSINIRQRAIDSCAGIAKHHGISLAGR